MASFTNVRPYLIPDSLKSSYALMLKIEPEGYFKQFA
jgi:hypothetical protein